MIKPVLAGLRNILLDTSCADLGEGVVGGPGPPPLFGKLKLIKFTK